MVFQTGPPQPASKARITWSPQLVGGPEASQNGFGQRMPPAKMLVRSATRRLLHDGESGALAVRHGVHHLTAAIDAIAAGIIASIRGNSGSAALRRVQGV